MNSTRPAILCEGLSKNYTSYKKAPGFGGSLKSLFKRQVLVKKALNELNLEISTGEIIGLLGANGAGKTTLMKILSGIIVPSAGQALVLGETPWKRRNSFKKQIALAMGQKNQLQWDLPAYDSFELIKEYYDIPHSAFHQRLDELVERLDVKSLLHIQVRRLSLGERMKVEIIACLLHKPQLIMLDEPTIGLDISAQEKLRRFFREYHQKYQPTIILTSHYMADIVALCPRIVLMSDGRKLFDGPRKDLTKILGQKKRLHLVFQKDLSISPQHPLLKPHNARWINGYEATLDIDRNTFRQTAAEILSQLPIEDFSTEEIPFETVMEKIIENPKILNT